MGKLIIVVDDSASLRQVVGITLKGVCQNFPTGPPTLLRYLIDAII